MEDMAVGKTDLISRAAAIDYLMTNMGWYGGLCRETGKYCQYATPNGGYCSMTACINHPSVEIITYPWMVEKPKEE